MCEKGLSAKPELFKSIFADTCSSIVPDPKLKPFLCQTLMPVAQFAGVTLVLQVNPPREVQVQ